MADEYETFDGIRTGRGDQSTRRKPAPMSQTPYLLKRCGYSLNYRP
jgi:hypothetical protein